MFRPGQEPKTLTNLNVIIADGGLGDLVCYLVVANYIKKEVTWINPLVWVPEYLVEFAKNVLPPKTIIRGFDDANKKYNEKMLGVSTRWITQHTPMRIHPIDFAAHMLIDADLPIEKKNYLRFNSDGYNVVEKFNLPKDYAVISVGSTSPVKELPSPIIDQISDYLKSFNIIPVFLGRKFSRGGGNREGGIIANISNHDTSKGIDLVDKTSICESAAIIEKAKLFVGMEGGLTHLAGCTDVKIVSGYTFITPSINVPIRNNIKGYNVFPVVPNEDLACKFCQSRITLLYSHDFRKCLFDDYLCVKQLTMDKWITKINEALNVTEW